MKWNEIDEKIRKEKIIEERIMDIIKKRDETTINDVSTMMNMDAEKVKDFVRDLFERGMIYEPRNGIFKAL